MNSRRAVICDFVPLRNSIVYVCTVQYKYGFYTPVGCDGIVTKYSESYSANQYLRIIRSCYIDER